MQSPSEYTTRYGTPRRTETQSLRGANGQPTNYTINRYGGMGDGFMMGYIMGSSPWYWGMPFHPAFYYSRPYTVMNPDGTTAVYPGTFQWSTLIVMLLIIGGVLFIGFVWMKNRRAQRFGGFTAQSAYGADENPGAKSSFM